MEVTAGCGYLNEFLYVCLVLGSYGEGQEMAVAMWPMGNVYIGRFIVDNLIMTIGES